MNEIIRGAIIFASAGCLIIIVVFALRAWKGKLPKRAERLSIDHDSKTTNELMKGVGVTRCQL